MDVIILTFCGNDMHNDDGQSQTGERQQLHGCEKPARTLTTAEGSTARRVNGIPLEYPRWGKTSTN